MSANSLVKNIVYQSDVFKLVKQLDLGPKVREANERGESCQQVIDDVVDVLVSRYSKEEIGVLDEVQNGRIMDLYYLSLWRDEDNPLFAVRQNVLDWCYLAAFEGLCRNDIKKGMGYVITGLYDMWRDALRSACDMASDDKPVCVAHKKYICKSKQEAEPKQVSPAQPDYLPKHHYGAGELRQRLKDEGVFDYIPWHSFSDPYFHKSNFWLSRKFAGKDRDGNDINFSSEELATVKRAMIDYSNRLTKFALAI